MIGVSITRCFEFDAGHRILGHESKCANLHGHRYRAEITVDPHEELDDLGRVVDFSVVKEEVGEWIDKEWDHNMILHPDDPLLKLFTGLQGFPHPVFGPKTPYVMPNDHPNPTVENMAKELWLNAVLLLSTWAITVLKVRLYETPNCWTDYPTQIMVKVESD